MLFQVEGTQVYLLASMHLLPEEWRNLRTPIWQAYRKSKICIFEDNVLVPRHPFPPMKSDLNTFYPWAQALIKSSELANEIGLTAEYGIDSQLLKKAIEDRITIDFLDTENACNAFVRAPIGEQELMLDMVLNQPHEVKTMLQGIYSTWRKWDVIALTELLEKQFRLFPETYHHLITLRNNAWSFKIINTITTRVPAIIAVGALHFIGNDGICHQVKNHGFNLLKIEADI